MHTLKHDGIWSTISGNITRNYIDQSKFIVQIHRYSIVVALHKILLTNTFSCLPIQLKRKVKSPLYMCQEWNWLGSRSKLQMGGSSYSLRNCLFLPHFLDTFYQISRSRGFLHRKAAAEFMLNCGTWLSKIFHFLSKYFVLLVHVLIFNSLQKNCNVKIVIRKLG